MLSRRPCCDPGCKALITVRCLLCRHGFKQPQVRQQLGRAISRVPVSPALVCAPDLLLGVTSDDSMVAQARGDQLHCSELRPWLSLMCCVLCLHGLQKQE